MLFDIRREQGRLSELLPMIELLRDQRVQIDNMAAQAHAEDGDLAGAREALVGGHIGRPVDDWWWIAEAVTAAELACELEDLEMGADLYRQLLPYSGWLACNGSISTAPPVDLYLGRLSLLLGDRATAETHLRAALDFAVAIPSPPFEAHAALRLGLLLGDVDLLARAAALADRLGMARVAEIGAVRSGMRS